MDVGTLANCFYNNESFIKKYWDICKYYDIKSTDWESVDSVESRKLEFTVDLGVIGKPRNFEEQKLLVKEPKKRYTFHSQSYSTGIMYCDYFTVNSKSCITRCSAKTSRLSIILYLEYKKQPNFVIKNIIEKNVFSRSKEWMGYFEKLLEEEQTSLARNSSSLSRIVDNTSKEIPTIKEEEEVVHVEQISNNNGQSAPLSLEQKKSSNKEPKPCVKYIKLFNWSIKMDTYIKAFVLATILIMVLNNRIYVKLNETEDLINNIIKSKSVEAKL